MIVVLFFFCLKGNASVVLAGDSTKSKYALNDPRNPDCPCHKYQKLAEEEYRQQQIRDGKMKEEHLTVVASSSSADGSKLSSRSHHKKIRARKHRVHGRHHGRERKQKKIWSCVHFR